MLLNAKKKLDHLLELARSFVSNHPTAKLKFDSWLGCLQEENLEELLWFCLNVAVLERASDLHFKPFEKRASVFIRKEGELREIFSFNIAHYETFLRILKNESKLPSYKQGVPQEGRLVFPFQSKELCVRVSIFPTILGEKAACRILNFKENLLALEELGMESHLLTTYKELLQTKKGMIVICGPAGSGKSTTLYASLLWLWKNTQTPLNIATIEDPVEYIVEEFSQTQVNFSTGMTFAQGLRSLLRQDPDVLAVGEIRDAETAVMALQAGLTGHLLLTTLHAPSPEGALKRLEELTGTSKAVSMSVVGVVHQMLVPKICSSCKGNGCALCAQKGKNGMVGKFKILS